MPNTRMDIADIRRTVLRALITRRYDGVARQLAIAAKKSEGQINDMLSDPPRKSFGEKVAQSLVKNLELTAGYFDNPENAGEASPDYLTKKPPRIVTANEPPPDERELLAGYRVASDDVRKLMLMAARNALIQQDFSERSETQ